MQERLQSNSKASTVPESVLRYNNMSGWIELRQALVDVFGRTSMSGVDLTAENLVLSAGVSTVLDHLFYLLGDENSSCLVPAPYYPAFDQDLGLKNGVHRLPVRLTSADTDISELDKAFRQAQSMRQPVCALLLTSPDNPTGIIYSEERMRAMIKWCTHKRVHCVVDEIYALSVFPEHAPMRSALSIAVELSSELDDKGVEALWEHFHVLVALSKDFCASGTGFDLSQALHQQRINKVEGVRACRVFGQSCTRWTEEWNH